MERSERVGQRAGCPTLTISRTTSSSANCVKSEANRFAGALVVEDTGADVIGWQAGFKKGGDLSQDGAWLYSVHSFPTR